MNGKQRKKTMMLSRALVGSASIVRACVVDSVKRVVCVLWESYDTLEDAVKGRLGLRRCLTVSSKGC